MTKMREMDPDLVRPPGSRNRADDGELTFPVAAPNELFLHPELRHCRRALFVDCLFQPDGGRPMCTLPRERGVHGRDFPRRPAAHDREVFFLDKARLHGETEAARRAGILRDQDEAAGLAVEPVHDRDLSAIRQFEGEQFAQHRPERGGAVGLARMDEQERRLVDHEVICGLGDDPEFRRRPCAGPGRG